MQIHCDVCGCLIEKSAAIVLPAEEGEVGFVCSEPCRVRAEAGHFDPMELPDADDRGIGSSVPVEQNDELS